MLDIAETSRINAERANEWHKGFPQNKDGWNGADWSNAMQGEAGEAGNVVKKLRREELGLPGSYDTVEHLGEELADTFLYMTLLATYYDIDLEAAIIKKFNEVSEREGFPQRLGDKPNPSRYVVTDPHDPGMNSGYMGGRPQTFESAIRTIMIEWMRGNENSELKKTYPRGLAPIDFLKEIERRWPGSFPLCTVIDAADAIKEITR